MTSLGHIVCVFFIFLSFSYVLTLFSRYDAPVLAIATHFNDDGIGTVTTMGDDGGMMDN